MSIEDLTHEIDPAASEGAAPEATPQAEPASIREAMGRALEAQEAKIQADKPAQPETAGDGRARDATGRFAQKEGVSEGAAKEAAQAAPEAQQTTIADPAAVSRPPSSWSDTAKAAFGALPPDVQAAVAKRESEVENGFRILQNYKGLEQFQEFADRAGIPQAEIMRRALEWEKSVINDPISTIRHIAQMRNIDPRLVAQALMDPNAPAPRVAPPQQPQVNVRGEVERMFREREVNSTVERFLADPANAHAPAVIGQMAGLINSGMAADLPSAYQMAIWANPQIRETLIKQGQVANSPTNKAAQAANQARQAGKAITGAPSRGQAPAAKAATANSIREAIEASYEAHAS